MEGRIRIKKRGRQSTLFTVESITRSDFPESIHQLLPIPKIVTDKKKTKINRSNILQFIN
jgi:hypothetical protein